MRYRYSKRCDTTQFANYYFYYMDCIFFETDVPNSILKKKTKNRVSPFFDHYRVCDDALYAYDANEYYEYRLDKNKFVLVAVNMT